VTFNDQDDANAPGTVIINEHLAQSVFAGEDPIGKRLRVDGDEGWLEIVGVSGNVRHFGLDASEHSEIYVSYRKLPWPFMSIVTRSRNGANLSNEIRTAIWRVDRDEPIPENRHYGPAGFSIACRPASQYVVAGTLCWCGDAAGSHRDIRGDLAFGQSTNT